MSPEFWTRSLHALGYDKAGVQLQCRLVHLHGVRPSCRNGILDPKCPMEETCTKSWDDRVLDAVENFKARGIIHKIAQSTDADFQKCSMAALPI